MCIGILFYSLFLVASCFGAATESKVAASDSKRSGDIKDEDPIDGLFVFKRSSFVYIKKGTYAEITQKLKECMPTLPINCYLFLENYSNPHIYRAWNDYIGTNYIKGKVKGLHNDVLIWQRTDVMKDDRED